MWPFRSSSKFEKYTAEEVSKHSSSSSLWIIAGNSVYDLTDIVAIHPGGAAALVACGGGKKDCEVDLFFHSPDGRAMWGKRKIGEINDEEKRKLLSMTCELVKNLPSTQKEVNEPAADDNSAESAFLNSPDWIVYNKRKATPPCCCRASISQ